MEEELFDDLPEGDLVVFGSTVNATLTPEQNLLISMVVLSLQDLNLEKAFSGLRKYFVIAKKEKTDLENMTSALEYLFVEDDEDYFLSFSNFCFVFKIEISQFRNLIREALKAAKGPAYIHYLDWSQENEIC